MIHNIDNQGNISLHCINPTCKYHNCQEWDQEIQCISHQETQRAQPPGETRIFHISEGVQWENENEIKLPPCPLCGDTTMVRIFSDEECTPPIIKRDELTGKILQVVPHPKQVAPWIKDADITHTAVPHPSLAHLSPDEIRAMQEQLRAKAPQAPVDWMLTTMQREEIHSVYLHPAVERHRELARQLRAISPYVPTLSDTTS